MSDEGSPISGWVSRRVNIAGNTRVTQGTVKAVTYAKIKNILGVTTARTNPKSQGGMEMARKLKRKRVDSEHTMKTIALTEEQKQCAYIKQGLTEHMLEETSLSCRRTG